MENVLFLVFGNHPKAATIKARAEKILRLLKGRGDWVELNDIEKELEMDRVENPSKFYKPLSALKKWRIVDSKRKMTGKNKYTTYYSFTQERFLTFIKDTLHAKCETELKMFK